MDTHGHYKEEELTSGHILIVPLQVCGDLCKFLMKKDTLVPDFASDSITAAVYPRKDMNMQAPIAFLLWT